MIGHEAECPLRARSDLWLKPLAQSHIRNYSRTWYATLLPNFLCMLGVIAVNSAMWSIGSASVLND
jgi:hypothetical protein